MSWRRAKTSGWAAFEPKKQQKEVAEKDPYPPISSNTSQNPSRNIDLTGRSFSSVLTHSASDDTLNSQSEKMTSKYIENNASQVYEKLKELHPWANENLILDIMAVVDNDTDKALSLLREMASPGIDTFNEVYLGSCEAENSVGETTSSRNSLATKNGILLDDDAFSGKVLLDKNETLGLMLDSLSMIPLEPEWEDDDMYIMHRKEAIRAMRLASRYSKAATEAYMRREHAAAQEFCKKAREEWSISEKLNAKAAKEILAIRNREKDDWELDLHGLHAAEAVQVLQDHLLKIESHHPPKPDKTNLKVGSSPRLLQVITGKGSHSRGQAALPVAIKSFLSEKGYYHYETRIGVITVQPKFHRKHNSLVL